MKQTLQTTGPAFTTAEAITAGQALGMSEDYSRRLLSRLGSGGLLRRLKGGLYAPAGILAEMSGHPHDFAIATKLVTPSAISHESALHFHDLIDQVPMRVTASSPRTVVPPGMRGGSSSESGPHDWVIDGVHFHYFRVRTTAMFGIRQVWVDGVTRVPMFDRERTLLDLWAHSYRSSADLGAQILAEHAGEIDLAQLVAYAEQLGRPAVQHRVHQAIAAIRAKA